MRVDIAAAIDIDRSAAEVYRANFGETYRIGEIQSIPSDWLCGLEADLWWMSPPCQPFSVRGKRAEGLDPRSQALWHILELSEQLQPACILLENVPGFRNSAVAEHMSRVWTSIGYRLHWFEICPSDFGWPNLRRRCYLVARLDSDFQLTPWDQQVRIPSIDEILLPSESFRDDDPIWLDAESIARFGSGLDRIERTYVRQRRIRSEGEISMKPTDRTACFGSSYGRSLKHAGSYLVTERGWRRFHPREVARLLGFPETMRIPDHLSYRTMWRLLGNSLSIPVVRWLVDSLASRT